MASLNILKDLRLCVHQRCWNWRNWRVPKLKRFYYNINVIRAFNVKMPMTATIYRSSWWYLKKYYDAIFTGTNVFPRSYVLYCYLLVAIKLFKSLITRFLLADICSCDFWLQAGMPRIILHFLPGGGWWLWIIEWSVWSVGIAWLFTTSNLYAETKENYFGGAAITS